MNAGHTILTHVQDCNGEDVLDLLSIADATTRRQCFYDALEMGFYHMPPQIMQRPDTIEGRECAVRVPFAHFSRSRLHFRVVAMNEDLRIEVKSPQDVDMQVHSLIAYRWHRQRGFVDRWDHSDEIVNDYFQELCTSKDKVVEFYDAANTMIGASLIGLDTDSQGQKIGHGYYFYYDPACLSQRQPGYAMMMLIVDALQRDGFDYFYPGIFKPDSPYSYKANIAPIIQRYNDGIWEDLPTEQRPRKIRVHPTQTPPQKRFSLKLV